MSSVRPSSSRSRACPRGDDGLGRPDLQLRFLGQTRNVAGLDEPTVVVENGLIRIRRQPIDRRWSTRTTAWSVASDGDDLILRRVAGDLGDPSPGHGAGEWLMVSGTPRAVIVAIPR